MIYIACDDYLVLILEPANLAKLKAGQPVKTPDNKILIAYTPDMEWTSHEIKGMVAIGSFTLDPKILDFILKEGLKRPEVMR